jgi:hypothetical protein
MTGALLLWLVQPTVEHLGLGVLIGRRQASEPGPYHDHIGVDARPPARFPAFALA